MAGSGNQRILINSKERLVSVDHNRLQSFLSRDEAQVLRYLYESSPAFFELSAGVEVVGSTTTSPLNAHVLNGLRAVPAVGSANLTVTAGVLLAVNTDADPDNSPLKWVNDPGLSTPLTLTANASGFIRMDVIECSLTDTLLESANRDVFNPSTGQFVPALVEKVRAGRLIYRIRTGTPAFGFPGTASGWLPLAVAAVPNGSVNWNTCTVWDVRPLVSDRWTGGPNSKVGFPMHRRAHIGFQIPAVNFQLFGLVEGVAFNGRHYAGGNLEFSSDVQYVEPRLATHQEPGTVFAANTPWYLWLVYPHSLPRWVRYSEFASGSRVPRGLRGIPVVSIKAPLGGSELNAGITLPVAYGFAGTHGVGFMAVAGLCDGAGVPLACLIDGTVTQIADGGGLISPSASTTNTADFTFADGVHWPNNARAVHLRFQGTFSNSGGAPFEVTLRRSVSTSASLASAATPTSRLFEGAMSTSLSPGGTFAEKFELRIPLMTNFPNFADATGRFIRWTHDAATIGGTMTNPRIVVVGWELGP